MTETVFYKRVGRKYVPVSYYDSEIMDAVPEGAHLIVKRKGAETRRYSVDPALAPLIAAGIYAEDKMTAALLKASEIRMPQNQQPLTATQVSAWNALAASFGKDMYQLEWPSYAEVARAGVKALEDEAGRLLTHPSVQAAYDHFILTCKLVSENTYE